VITGQALRAPWSGYLPLLRHPAAVSPCSPKTELCRSVRPALSFPPLFLVRVLSRSRIRCLAGVPSEGQTWRPCPRSYTAPP